MSFDRTLVPRWRPGYRFQFETAQDAHVLLYPEGMIRFNASAGAIGALIDTRRDVAAIIAELERDYPGADTLAADVEAFMETACERFWLELA